MKFKYKQPTLLNDYFGFFLFFRFLVKVSVLHLAKLQSQTKMIFCVIVKPVVIDRTSDNSKNCKM